MRVSASVIFCTFLVVAVGIPLDLKYDSVLPDIQHQPRSEQLRYDEEKATKVRPVIFLRGIFGDLSQSDFASQYISQHVPGTVVYPINLWLGIESARNLYTQLSTILPAMQAIMDNHTDTGVTLLCYSQGGVICRAAVQMLSTHNVHTMITLSSPLAGQYGVTGYVSPFIPNKDRSVLWRFWYTEAGQDISIGNYWNDPHHQKEFSDPKLDVIIARLNNQTGHNQSAEYKANFERLQKLVMVGGPDDKVITPWQSAQLGFYNQNETVDSFEKMQWYINNDFGLRTLDEGKKIVRYTYLGVDHNEWYRTPKVYDYCVIPYIT